MPNYRCLNQNTFKNGKYSLVPIRMEDRYDIMRWRNEQIYHLRQKEPLTEAQQDQYFEEVVSKLFAQEKPNQILFSFLEGEQLIGYGGLVHINWEDKNAEVSFIMNTAFEDEQFQRIWSEFIELLKKLAFEDLSLKKIYVYAFDLRPHLYHVLEKNAFFLDARLKNHCYFNGEFKDVVIYSYLNTCG